LEPVSKEVIRHAHLAGDPSHFVEMMGGPSGESRLPQELIEKLRLRRLMMTDNGDLQLFIIGRSDDQLANGRNSLSRQLGQRRVEFGHLVSYTVEDELRL